MREDWWSSVRGGASEAGRYRHSQTDSSALQREGSPTPRAVPEAGVSRLLALTI